MFFRLENSLSPQFSSKKHPASWGFQTRSKSQKLDENLIPSPSIIAVDQTSDESRVNGVVADRPLRHMSIKSRI